MFPAFNLTPVYFFYDFHIFPSFSRRSPVGWVVWLLNVVCVHVSNDLFYFLLDFSNLLFILRNPLFTILIAETPIAFFAIFETFLCFFKLFIPLHQCDLSFRSSKYLHFPYPPFL